ncbi:MAG: F0F1 ATP synthase subunit gamma, partial [Gammaproteobacteria bacterium]|nr:F0F1 ATP synthase subunit gamma [Gammaproteobacteria bacterium]
EARKLAKFIDCQRTVVATIRATAADFLASYPAVIPERRTDRPVLLAIGTDRGFCGDFNALVRDRVLALAADGTAPVVAVGRKLAADLEPLGNRLQVLDGATTADEVPQLLQHIVALLDALSESSGGLSVRVVHHGGDAGRLIETVLLPAFADLDRPEPVQPNPVRLYLTPGTFFAGLVEQYLFAQLYEIAFTSLLHEHQRRVQHLEGATQRLEETLDTLARRQSTLRQEEITEELEVILLGVDLIEPGSD